MKKNLFLLFALLCTVTFFTACSEDEDTSWQQIPTEEIKGDNAELTVNGETIANGSVKFEAKSAEQAVVTLDNVILAYPKVAVDVTMAKQADGSYDLFGEKGMTTIPGTRAADQAIIATIKVTGNVSLDGKVEVEANTVVNDPNGWAATYGMADYATGILNKYGIVTAGALYVNWEGIEDEAAPLYSGLLRGVGGMLLPQVLKNITLGADGNIMAEYVASPTIQMDQSKIMSMIFGIVPTVDEVKATIPTTGWQSSPKNLAYWYENGGKLYIKLNIASILTQATGTDASSLAPLISQILNGDAAKIKELLKTMLEVNLDKVPDDTFTTLLSWVNNGIPMNVKTEDGKTRIYLDKDDLAVLFKSFETGEANSGETSTGITEIWTALVAAKMIPAEMESAGFLVAVMASYYGMSTAFDLGLDLTK